MAPKDATMRDLKFPDRNNLFSDFEEDLDGAEDSFWDDVTGGSVSDMPYLNSSSAENSMQENSFHIVCECCGEEIEIENYWPTSSEDESFHGFEVTIEFMSCEEEECCYADNESFS